MGGKQTGKIRWQAETEGSMHSGGMHREEEAAKIEPRSQEMGLMIKIKIKVKCHLCTSLSTHPPQIFRKTSLRTQERTNNPFFWREQRK